MAGRKNSPDGDRIDSLGRIIALPETGGLISMGYCFHENGNELLAASQQPAHEWKEEIEHFLH